MPLPSILLLLMFALGLSAEPSAELTRLSKRYLKTGAADDRAALAKYAGSARGREQGLARFALGMGDHEAKEFSSAASELEKAQAVDELGDYVLYYQGRSLAQDQLPSAGFLRAPTASIQASPSDTRTSRADVITCRSWLPASA